MISSLRSVFAHKNSSNSTPTNKPVAQESIQQRAINGVISSLQKVFAEEKAYSAPLEKTMAFSVSVKASNDEKKTTHHEFNPDHVMENNVYTDLEDQLQKLDSETDAIYKYILIGAIKKIKQEGLVGLACEISFAENIKATNFENSKLLRTTALSVTKALKKQVPHLLTQTNWEIMR